MFRMLIHPSSGACDLFVELFHGLYCSGSMCVGVKLRFGCGGVVSVCRLQPAYGYHTRKCVYRRNLRESDRLEDSCLDRRMILNWIFTKWYRDVD